MNRAWLIEKRKNKGLPQWKVAHECGISQQTYSLFESGVRRPKYETAIKIASTLGFDWTRFFEDSENAS